MLALVDWALRFNEQRKGVYRGGGGGGGGGGGRESEKLTLIYLIGEREREGGERDGETQTSDSLLYLMTIGLS